MLFKKRLFLLLILWVFVDIIGWIYAQKSAPAGFFNFSYSPPFKNTFIVLAIKNAEQV
jgi:hypothetical protein